MRVGTQGGLQVLRRAFEFLVAKLVTAGLGSITKHVEILGQIVDRLATHAVEQGIHERGHRASARAAQEQSRALMVEFMRPVARRARSLFPDDPKIREALTLPKVKSYEKVIAGALAMADRAEEHKVRFVQAGFDEDFVDRLRKAATDLRVSLDEKGVHLGKRSAASAGMLEELGRGKDLLRVLDDMVAAGMRATPDRLAEWRTLTRFVRPSPAKEESTRPPPVGTPNGSTPVGPEGTPAATTAEPPVVTASPSSATEVGASVDRAA